jgi:tetratricopeptide (TPR) repeat protein
LPESRKTFSRLTKPESPEPAPFVPQSPCGAPGRPAIRRRPRGNSPASLEVLPPQTEVLLKAFLIPALFGLALIASAQQPVPLQQVPAPQPTPERVPGAVTSPGNAKWAASVDEAKAAEGKNVFVELDRPQCGACSRMDSLLYRAFDFEALLIPMVPVKLSMDGPEGRELARRYGFRQAPTVLVTNPEGRLIFLMEGFANAPDFYQRIQQDMDKYREFAKRVEAQDVAKLSAKEALDTGRELYQRSDAATALPRLQRAASLSKAPAAIRDEAREILAAVELDLGQIAQSRRTTDLLIATTHDPLRKERAELFRAQIPLAENNPTEALARFQKFQKDHPKSPYAERVRAMLARLTDPKAL